MSQEVDDSIAHRNKVLSELHTRLNDLNANLIACSRIEPIQEPCCAVEIQALENSLSAMLAKNEQLIKDINAQSATSIGGAVNFGAKCTESVKEQRLIELCNTPCWRYKA